MTAGLGAKLWLDSSDFTGGMNKALRESNAIVGKMSNQFNTLRNVFTGGLAGGFGVAILRDITEAGLEAEKLSMAMQATTGSADLGRMYLKDVKALAGEIGVEVSTAAKAMLQFQGAGMSAAKSMDMIRAGFNATLSAGGGSVEFGRWAYGIQQVYNSTKPLAEDIGIIREALPNMASLMMETFGTTRAEDLQKLGMSGREFVNTLLEAMQAMPQLGETTAKEIGKMQNKFKDLKADAFAFIEPSLKFGIDALTDSMNLLKNAAKGVVDEWYRFRGVDMEFLKKAGEAANAATRKRAEAAAMEKNAKKDAEIEAKRNTEAMKKSEEQGKSLANVYSKFEDIFKKAADAAREFRDALNFEDKMREFLDSEKDSDWEKALDDTRRKASEEIGRIRAEKDAAAAGVWDAIETNEAMLPDAWREAIRKKGLSKSERKAERQADRERENNARRAADEQTRKQMREERKAARDRSFDDLKNNKGWWDEEATKKAIRDKNRKEAGDASKSAAMTLIEIKTILHTLATA